MVKLTKEMRQNTFNRFPKYNQKDPELDLFLDTFDEAPGRVLEIGSGTTPLGSLLSDYGFNVTSVDLKPRDFPDHRVNHIVADWCDMHPSFWSNYRGYFDYAVSVSALEHFGLGAYKEEKGPDYYDVFAVRYIWDALKRGGAAYIEVPFGGRHVVVSPHWRVYDWESLSARILQQFTLSEVLFRVVQECRIEGLEGSLKIGDGFSPLFLLNQNGAPCFGVSLRLVKHNCGVVVDPMKKGKQ